jgi:rhodanese-related sulfurtransferase
VDIDTIGREDLKAMLERGDDFKLVMAMNEWAYNAAHIPGSINVATVEAGARLLAKDDTIIVYCSDEACVASKIAYIALVEGGYQNVRRYSGGLSDWDDAGYPLEGTRVDS